MLQQTRAQAVIPYYERFLDALPHGRGAGRGRGRRRAGAVERPRLLLARAQPAPRGAGDRGGRAASRATTTRSARCPGIGDYTAAAVASIAFGLPHAVLDGNVLRVVARVRERRRAISRRARTRERFRAVAQAWLDPREPGPFQPGADGARRDGLPAAQSAVPGVPAGGDAAARAQEGTAAQLAGEAAQDGAGGDRRRAAGRAERGRVLLRQRDASARRMAGFWDLPAPEDLPDARVGKTSRDDSATPSRITITRSP